MEKQENNGNGNGSRKLKNRDEKMTRKMDMERLQAMLQLLSLLLYGLDVGNYAKV